MSLALGAVAWWVSGIVGDQEPIGRSLYALALANIAIGRELNERAPQASYAEIKGIGHFPNAEAPDEIAKQILLATGL